MKDKTVRHSEIAKILGESDLTNIESCLMELIYDIEASPAHSELPTSLQLALNMVANRVTERSWPDEYLAMGFFTLGKAAIYPGELDVTKLASKIITKVCSKHEARQILISIENHILSDQEMDNSAAKAVMDFLYKSPENWNSDISLRNRVIEGIGERIE